MLDVTGQCSDISGILQDYYRDLGRGWAAMSCLNMNTLSDAVPRRGRLASTRIISSRNARIFKEKRAQRKITPNGYQEMARRYNRCSPSVR